MTRRNLRLIPPEAEQPIDINALNRADIAARDWAKVHVVGDRRAPVELPSLRRRGWR